MRIIPVVGLAILVFVGLSLSARAEWQYSSDKDALTLKTTYFAQVESKNTVNFSFPYAGAQHATLTLRTHPQYGKDVILSIDKGQFLCTSYSGCTVRVRFDENAPVAFTAFGPSDHSTTPLFIRNYSKFVGLMTNARVVVVQAEFFHQGNHIFEFDVSAFDQKKYRPK